MKNDYNDIKILFYQQHNIFVINNYDIIFISLINVLIFFYLVIIFCKVILFNIYNCCNCFSTNKSKNKIKKNKTKKELKLIFKYNLHF